MHNISQPHTKAESGRPV